MSKPVVCIGAALVDELFYASETMMLRTTNNVTAKRSPGGVSRNIAHQLALLGIPVQLISVFGNDSDAAWLQQICSNAGVQLDAAITTNETNGKYTGIIDADGSLFTALLTNSLEHHITAEHLAQQEVLLNSALFLLADANVPVASMEWLIRFSVLTNIPLIIEPVSVGPASKLSGMDLKGLYMVTPNEDELPAMCTATDTDTQIEELFERGVEFIWLHRGAAGSVLYNKKQTLSLNAPSAQVVDCTGAGDGSLTGFIMAKLAGLDDRSALKTAHTLAAEILQVNGAIATHLNKEQLLQLVPKYYDQ